MSLTLISPKGSIGGITIDVTVRESYTDGLEVTRHPVESGAAITDHSYRVPSRIELDCGWSNAGASAALNNLQSYLTGTGGSAAALANGQMNGSDYASRVYSQLLALQQSRQIFSVTTTFRTYNNMLIESIDVERDQKSANILRCVATCTEILTVSAISTTLPPQANQANPASTAETISLGANSVTSGFPSPGGSLPPTSW